MNAITLFSYYHKCNHNGNVNDTLCILIYDNNFSVIKLFKLKFSSVITHNSLAVIVNSNIIHQLLLVIKQI